MAISDIQGTQKEGVAWSPDGEKIAFGDLTNAYVYNVSTGLTDRVAELPDLTSHFHSFSWSPEGRYLTIVLNGGHD